MKSSKWELVKPTVVLLVLCLIISAALAVTYHFTAASTEIDPEKIIAEMSPSYAEVLPTATSFEYVVRTEGYAANVKGEAVEVIRADTGWCITAHSSGQYDSDPIRVLVGISNDGKVTGVKLLRITETPGMGQRCNTNIFLSQFEGGTGFSLDGKSGEKIDAVTSATKSSRAVMNAVNLALEKFAEVSAEGGEAK